MNGRINAAIIQNMALLYGITIHTFRIVYIVSSLSSMSAILIFASYTHNMHTNLFCENNRL